MIYTYSRAYGLGKDRSDAGVDSRVLPVTSARSFSSLTCALSESFPSSLRVRCHSNLRLDTQSSRLLPLRVRFRPNPRWDSSRGCPARVGPCPPGTSEVPSGGAQGDPRWGRIRWYPVHITFSIVMIMLLTLNEGV